MRDKAKDSTLSSRRARLTLAVLGDCRAVSHLLNEMLSCEIHGCHNHFVTRLMELHFHTFARVKTMRLWGLRYRYNAHLVYSFGNRHARD